jgi:hypothetical protein
MELPHLVHVLGKQWPSKIRVDKIISEDKPVKATKVENVTVTGVGSGGATPA